MEANTDKLHSLLFTEARELVNIKFMPGSDRGLTAARLKDAAATALASALSGSLENNPPHANEATSLEDFLATV